MSTKLRVFAVYDEKAAAFITPFFLPETGMAQRVFTDCINDPEHQFGLHPEDYSLHQLAIWDATNAKFEVAEKPQLVVSGLQIAAISHQIARGENDA